MTETWLPQQLTLWWINSLIQVTGISSLGWLIAFCIRKNAATRYWVLCATLLLCLISPLAAVLMTGRGLTLITLNDVSRTAKPAATREHVHQSPDEFRLDSTPANPARSMDSTSPAAMTNLKQPATFAHRETAHVSPSALIGRSAPGAIQAAGMIRPAASLMMVIWALGTLPLLLKTLCGYAKLARILSGADRSVATNEQGLLTRSCDSLGVRRVPSLCTSGGISSPLVVGLLRPVIVLPEGISRWLDRRQLADVLTHELAHVVRRDRFIAPWQNIARIIFWPHPIVRLVNVFLSRSREEVCDNYVLRFADARSYSRTLLRVAEKLRVAEEGSPGATHAGLLTSHWKLESRVSGILSEGRSVMTHSNAAGRMLILCTAASLAAISLVTTVATADPAPQHGEAAALDAKTDPRNSDEAGSLKHYLLAIESMEPDRARLETLEKRATELLLKYQDADQRGRICAKIAQAHGAGGSASRSVAWAQTALNYPLSPANRLRMFQCWYDANRTIHETTGWHELLPLVLGYLESTGDQPVRQPMDETVPTRKHFSGRIAKLIAKNRTDSVTQRLTIDDASALLTPARDRPSWLPEKTACVFSYQIDWQQTVNAAPLWVDRFVDSPGFFEDLLASLRDDPNGPRIDVRDHLLPYLDDRITIAVDYREMLTAQGPSLLLGIDITDAPAVRSAINKVLKPDPDARRIEVGEFPAWELGAHDSRLARGSFILLTDQRLLISSDPEFLRRVTE